MQTGTFSGPAGTGGAATGDPAWYTDLRVLWRRPAEFFPAAEHTPEERLNACVRLVGYACAALSCVQPSAVPWLYGGVAVAAISGAHASAASTPPPSAGRAAKPRTRRAQAKPECVRSTPDNPFANFLLGDDPARPPACAYDDMKDEIRTNFNRGLYRSLYDVYERQNGQLLFNTAPVTTAIPDAKSFAEFCYGSMARPTCKEDTAACARRVPR